MDRSEKKQELQRTLSKSIPQELRRSNTLTDATILCSDGGKVNAHRVILSANCEYFLTLFTSNFTEAASHEVNFQEFPIEAVNVLVSHLYAEVMDESFLANEKSVIYVLRLAHFTNMKALFDFCWHFYLTFLNVDNYKMHWPMSELYCKEFSVFSYLFGNLGLLIETTDFLSMSAQQIKHFIKFAKKFAQKYEMVKFIRLWGEAKEERANDSEDLYLQYINIISPGFVTNGTVLPVFYLPFVEQPRNIKIHFFVKIRNTGKLHSGYVFNTVTKVWTIVNVPNLPNYWKPVVIDSNKTYYMRYTEHGSFLCFVPEMHATYQFSPQSFIILNRAIRYALVYPNIFVTSRNSMHRFNVINKSWKTVTTDCVVIDKVMGKIDNENIIVSSKEPTSGIYVYSLAHNLWLLKTQTTLFRLKTKCLCDGECSGSMYFRSHSPDLLVTYRYKKNEWLQQTMPCGEGRIFLIANCDVPFLLYSDADVVGRYWIYHVYKYTWEKIQLTGIDDWPEFSYVDVDLSLFT